MVGQCDPLVTMSVVAGRVGKLMRDSKRKYKQGRENSMYWNTMISSVGIRSSVFTNYDTAKQFYDSVKPIRGDKLGRRPLGANRRYKHLQIVHDDLSNCVSAVCYSTKCFSIFDNGMIKIEHGGYISPTTMSFLDAVVPVKYGRLTRKRGRMIYHEPSTGRQFVVPQEGIWLKADDNWSGAVLFESDDLPVQNTLNSKLLSAQHEYKADRKVLNSIRAKLKPFLDTVKVMSSMSNTYTSDELCELYPDCVDEYMRISQKEVDELIADAIERGVDLGAVRWYSPAHVGKRIIEAYVSAPTFNAYSNSFIQRLSGHSFKVTELMDSVRKHGALMELILSGDAVKMRRAMFMIATNMSNPNYKLDRPWDYDVPKFIQDFKANLVPMGHARYNGRITEGVFPNIEYTISGNSIEHYIIEIVKYFYADVVFKKVEVPSGRVPSDTNVKYVSANRVLQMYIQDTVTNLSLCPTE
jgi:hypothetical protein